MAEDEDEPGRRGPLIALVVIVLLVIAGIWISQVLHRTTSLEDCLMAHRTNCAPVQSPSK